MQFWQKVKLVFAMLVPAFLLLGTAVAWAQITAAGTEIFNQARADYQDAAGNRFSALSTRVNFIVRAVPRVTVAPDETEPSAVVAPNDQISRVFRVCNTGNVADSYVVSNSSASSPATITAIYFDADDSGTQSQGDIPMTPGQTQTPQIPIRECFNIVKILATNAIGVGERLTIDLSMRSTSDPSISDAGRIINIAGNGPILTSPDDPNAPPRKLVNNVRQYVATPGERLTYTIAFRNRGDVAARNVVVTDELARELEYVPNSLRIDNRALTDAMNDDEGGVAGRRIEFRLAQPVAPDRVVTLSFQAATVMNIPAGTGISNTADFTSANAPAATTNPAIVIMNPFGVVYSGNSGGNIPIPNARVGVFEDAELEIPAVFPPVGFDPNPDNVNPFVSNQQGRYTFALSDSNSLGSRSYFVNVSAESYRTRMLEISVNPVANNLHDVTVRALDGMPVAIAGGFELTNENVSLSDVAAIAFNIPMFARSTLEIIKTADRAQAEIGDNVNYRIDLHNAGSEPLVNVSVTDELPASFSYIAGTAQITRGRAVTSIEPVLNGNRMTFGVGQLGASERVSITYRVRVGVNARGDQINVAVASGIFPNGDTVTTEPARALVRITAGLFSMRQIIVGRVFVDSNKNNLFDRGEKGVAGVRLYLAGGASVITDSEGLYSFPAVAEGTQVIEIDPLTIPAGHYPLITKVKATRSWTRLLRAPLGGGGLLRQNFALIAASSENQDSKTPETVSDKNVLAKFVKSDTKTVSGAEPASEEKNLAPLAVGGIRVENLTDREVVKSPAMILEVSVSARWTVDITLNGEAIGENSIGTTREDHRNQVTTFTFVGLGLKPGPNVVRVTGVGPQGEKTAATELVVFGRGSARRIEIEPTRRQLEASGRDKTVIKLRAFDEWNNPAQDAALAVQTSSGSLLDPKAEKKAPDALAETPENQAAAQQTTVNMTDGTAEIELVSGNQTGDAEIKAILGNAEATTNVRFVPEMRPAFLVGLGEVSFGRNAPVNEVFGTDRTFNSTLQLFFRGPIFGRRNLLTFAYDSNRSLNRIAGQDRMFQLSPLERNYPILGDSSTRFQDTESNSKIYARVDRGRSYAMFGDFEADMTASRLVGYSRKLTGVKLHFENENGDFVTVTGARPDTAFARQIIPGGSLGLVALDFSDILPGSETLVLEIRDRRNPEIILRREPLSRGVDYNIDVTTGTVVFLRAISAFDYELNLLQVVATYEHRSNGIASGAYTARAGKSFKDFGLKLGFSMIDQRQQNSSPFRLAGFDFTQKLPGKGMLEGEFAISRGFYSGGLSGAGESANQNGNALFLMINQPLPNFLNGSVKGEFSHASAGFFNPFGATITPGSTRAQVGLELKPFGRSTFKFNLINEKNKTSNVDNQRTTAGISWSQILSSKIRLNLAYDFRSYSDRLTDRVTNSNLITIGADWKPSDRLEFAVKREQNLTDADPSYPNQTTFSAGYRVNDFAKIFFTQRLAAAEISPIADVGGTGFSASKARRETAFGIETKLGRYTNLVGRYQLENGVNSRDSFAVIGLNNRLPLNKKVALDFGFERGFHIAGGEKSFNNGKVGVSYTPNDSFRASARYELRDRGGLGQLFSAGAAGILKPGWTTLTRFQYGKIVLGERRNRIMDGQAALAIRPRDTDRYGLLFSYNYRNSFLQNKPNEAPTRLRADTLSTDGFYQLSNRTELFGRTALRVSGDGNPALPFASTMTWLLQARVQHRLTNSFDLAAETRSIFQPVAKSFRTNYAVETGFWATPDLRFAVGYNLRRMGDAGFGNRSGGVYFTVTTKISSLFNLFGTSKKGLKAPAEPFPAADALAATR